MYVKPGALAPPPLFFGGWKVVWKIQRGLIVCFIVKGKISCHVNGNMEGEKEEKGEIFQ